MISSRTNIEKIKIDAPSLLCPTCGMPTSAAHYRYQHETGEAYIYRCPSCTFEFLRPLPLAKISERQMRSVDDAEMFQSPLLRRLHESLIIRPEIRQV